MTTMVSDDITTKERVDCSHDRLGAVNLTISKGGKELGIP